MNLSKLKQFLIDSNGAGYAGGEEKKWTKETDGSTTIPYKKGELIYFGGDYISIYYSDSLLVGSISIDQYDETNNVCSGTFNFNATFFEPYSNQNFIYELEEGTFSVPIYK